MFSWRKSSKRKKVMPLPLSSLCKHMFDTALANEKGSTTITPQQAVDLIMKEWAAELDCKQIVAPFWDIDAESDVDESKFLYLVEFVWRKVEKKDKNKEKLFPAARFKHVFASASDKEGSTIKLKRARDAILEECASEVNGRALIDLLKRLLKDGARHVNEAEFFELVRKLEPLAGVHDVVDFYDKLVRIEEERKCANKPAKLEFLINGQSQRLMDMHRIIDSIQRDTILRDNLRDSSGKRYEHKLCFEGEIRVRCAPMKADSELRAAYLRSIEEINALQRVNDDRLKDVTAEIKVLSSFLFILARALMHDKKVCDTDVEATSSLGLISMKQFKSFASDAIFNAETEAYDKLGITLDAMRSGSNDCSKEDIHHIRARFRQLCFASIKELHSSDRQGKKFDYVTLMRGPFRRLKKPQLCVANPLEIPKSGSSDVFTVATVWWLCLF